MWFETSVCENIVGHPKRDAYVFEVYTRPGLEQFGRLKASTLRKYKENATNTEWQTSTFFMWIETSVCENIVGHAKRDAYMFELYTPGVGSEPTRAGSSRLATGSRLGTLEPVRVSSQGQLHKKNIYIIQTFFYQLTMVVLGIWSTRCMAML